METLFMTAIEIAQTLKISKALAYQLIARKEIASVRFGRTVRVSAQSLDEFIRKNSTNSPITDIRDQDSRGINKSNTH